ncbi:MAG: cobalamin biosynthesis protein, partial [Alphaproteobacteria bacterium]|nr:cobalamin biosynthesis protein [Alphaproteobacteria bacterium]
RTTRTDLSRMDDFGITRVTMAMVARSFDKGLVAPIFWFLLFGLPGAYIYAGLACFAWRFGKDSYTKGFGRTALLLERLLGYVPMTVSGSLMATAGLFTPTGGMTRAVAALMNKKGAAPYYEGGLPVTAMAYALDVSLGGPVTDLDGSALKRAWVGPETATAKLEAGHLRRALYMSLMAHLLLVATVLGGLLWVGKLL